MDSGWKERLEEELDTLRRGRDELRVKVNLGAAEARDAWEKVEKQWSRLEARLKAAGQAGQESAEDVEEAAKLLLQEIKAGYKNIRDAL